MIPGFGKQTLIIGSAPTCDIVVQAGGVAPEHAKLVHQGGGQLVFINSGTGQTMVNGRAMAAGEQATFDFRTPFQVGQASVPFDHPAIALSLMAQGQQAEPAGRMVLGRDPTQVSIVLQHPSVSSRHCSVALDRMMVTDNDSTSGTYVGGQRVAPNNPTPLPPQGAIHLGPVPVPVSLLMQLAQAAQGGGASQVQPQAQGQQPVGAGTVGVNIVQPQGGGGGHQAAQVSGAPAKKHKTVFGQIDFGAGGGGGAKTIGRTDNNDIVIPHPQVSSAHAEVKEEGGRLYVTDKGSANGTYVRGHRLAPNTPAEISSGEKVYIGPMPLQLHIEGGQVQVYNDDADEAAWAGRPLYEIEAWSLFKEVPDRDDKSKMKVLLDRVSFKALPGDMIALMGPSGAGKTTLLLTLNGYLPPTEGLVRINGEDLYDIYDTLRGSIGYVPQDDLVHPELTVWEAVRYSAKFRLPPDYSEEEIDGRVNQTLKDLGLEGVAHLQIGSPEQKVLSGGQRKRVNIALELVTDPVIIYLDEPTSGLAADDAASLVQLLHELTSSTGKTIIMTIHQPAKDEYEKFTHALILGYGGTPMFYGQTTPDSYQFFSSWAQNEGINPKEWAIDKLPVENPRDMFALITARETPIYRQMQAQYGDAAQRSDARAAGAQRWNADYFSDQNPIYKRMYSGKRSVGTDDGHRGVPAGRPTTRGQFRLLLSRYFKTKVRDKVGTGILLLQAPIIGVLLAVVFGWQAEEVPAWCLGALQQLAQRTGEKGGEVTETLAMTQDHTAAVFFLVVSAIWFGTSNAAREIVKERSIYLRERMVNLGLLNYLMSKFVLLCVLCVVQCTMLLGIVFFALGFSGGMPAFLQELGALVATAIAAVSIGLLISTLVTSSEAAQALTPIALIPQVVLGGVMVPATTIPKLNALMYVIPARWGFEATVVAERAAITEDPAWLIPLGQSDKTSAVDFVFNGKFHCATAQMASDQLTGAWAFTTHEDFWVPYAVLGGMCLVMFVAILVILKRRDPV